MYTDKVYIVGGYVIRRVEISRWAQKDIARLPSHIQDKLFLWVRMIELCGIYEVRKISGFHDEPLSGNRKGERSVRLNRGYRVIYRIRNEDVVEFIWILGVNKHEY